MKLILQSIKRILARDQKQIVQNTDSIEELSERTKRMVQIVLFDEYGRLTHSHDKMIEMIERKELLLFLNDGLIYAPDLVFGEEKTIRFRGMTDELGWVPFYTFYKDGTCEHFIVNVTDHVASFRLFSDSANGKTMEVYVENGQLLVREHQSS